MNFEKELHQRSQSCCELCTSKDDLLIYAVPPVTVESIDRQILICHTCHSQINATSEINPTHWHCLKESMWSEVSAVKVIAWRMLNRLRGEGWSNDLLEMIYLEPEELKWAQATGEGLDDDEKIIHRDSNGTVLQAGDTVTLIKDLDVKGGGFTAKRGTSVRNITLVDNNAEHIEGRVEGQHIVILTKYVKKT